VDPATRYEPDDRLDHAASIGAMLAMMAGFASMKDRDGGADLAAHQHRPVAHTATALPPRAQAAPSTPVVAWPIAPKRMLVR
jgi:hypothetical protein